MFIETRAPQLRPSSFRSGMERLLSWIQSNRPRSIIHHMPLKRPGNRLPISEKQEGRAF